MREKCSFYPWLLLLLPLSLSFFPLSSTSCVVGTRTAALESSVCRADDEQASGRWRQRRRVQPEWHVLEYPLQIPKDDLLPHPLPRPSHDEETKLILLVQVTAFACGGFVVGFRFSHAVADGMGAAKFMGAVGELARGVEQVSVSPVWARDAILDPPGALVSSLPDPTGAKRLEYLAIDISADYIDHFKSQFAAATSGGRCSAFEVLIAKAWQSRTRAAGFDDPANTPVQLCFAMNARPLVVGGGAAPTMAVTRQQQLLPAGFYGNCSSEKRHRKKEPRVKRTFLSHRPAPTGLRCLWAKFHQTAVFSGKFEERWCL